MGGPDASLTCRRPTVGRRGAPNFLIGPRGRARETDRAGRPSGRLNPEFLRRSARGPVRVKNGSHNSRPDGQSFTAAPVGTEFCQRSACAREGWTVSVLTGLRSSRWRTSNAEFFQRSARAREKRTALAPAALRSVTVSCAQPESGAGGFSAPSALVFSGAFVGVAGHGRRRRAAGRFGRPLSALIRTGGTSPGFFLRILRRPKKGLQAPPAASADLRPVSSCTLLRRLRFAGFAVP